MKQLLLLLTIHSLIFHQQEKDKKEKLFITLEKGATLNTEPKMDWNFIIHARETEYDSLYSHVPESIIYHFRDYSYTAVKARK
ncbi:MAG TPA: hypothetical protein VJU78_11730 [Chitinophagaceae bacterium]|nr:hypothetical protein [Chitinophagaceae bacterium]